ncbi:competence protein CoiA family protein [Acinetobacter sp. Marseille-Q1618]|uniref:competence protein CoiA family protein n=1 Tax=Acinetobacter sp. Marseille-Q1618 TaxID=2697502 RepID=UPI00156E2A94|nr:competence protein CoiA family protein [Acinetobacter sp. Marseille-Q1618]
MTMKIALDENNRIVKIENVNRGLACNCTCFTCGETVLARKGDIKEHHFAHASNKESCFINTESLLHKYAKEVVLESMGLILPALPNHDLEAAWWTFDRILPEFKLGVIRPDLVAYVDGETILIEIAVTHFIDHKKLNYLEMLQLKCIEIDLSSLLKNDIEVPSEAIKKEILENIENRKWVYPISLDNLLNKPNDDTVKVEVLEVSIKQEQKNNQAPWQDYKFRIKGINFNARKFSSGMVSVNCTFNPEMIQMLKEWKNEGRGSYQPKYKSWNYWLPFSETVLERLKQMNEL